MTDLNQYDTFSYQILVFGIVLSIGTNPYMIAFSINTKENSIQEWINSPQLASLAPGQMTPPPGQCPTRACASLSHGLIYNRDKKNPDYFGDIFVTEAIYERDMFIRAQPMTLLYIFCEFPRNFSNRIISSGQNWLHLQVWMG